MAQIQQSNEKSILIVEDNVLNQEYMYEVLSDYEADLSLAVDGKEAVEKVLNNADHYDLVFMDIQMPNMDGITATEIIRETYNQKILPIIAVTANTSADDKRKCLSAGMNEFITKPARIKTIRKIISDYSDIVRKNNKSDQNTTKNKTIINGIDFTELLSILKNNQATLASMLTDFLQKYKQIDYKVSEYVTKNNFSDAADFIHTLKGTSGNLMLTKIYSLSLKIELAIKKESPDLIIPLLSGLKNELIRLDIATNIIKNNLANNEDDKISSHHSSEHKNNIDLADIDNMLKTKHLGVLDKFLLVKDALIAATNKNDVDEVEHYISTLDFDNASKKLHQFASHLIKS